MLPHTKIITLIHPRPLEMIPYPVSISFTAPMEQIIEHVKSYDRTGAFMHFTFIKPFRIGVLYMVKRDDDSRNQNGKPITPPLLKPSIYCHYFHTLLIPLQYLTCS